MQSAVMLGHRGHRYDGVKTVTIDPFSCEKKTQNLDSLENNSSPGASETSEV